MMFSEQMAKVIADGQAQRAAVRIVERTPVRYKRALPTLLSGSGPLQGSGRFGGGCLAVAGEIEGVAVTSLSSRPKGLFELQVVNVDGSGEVLSFRLEQTTYNRSCRVVFKTGATFHLFFTSDEIQAEPPTILWGLSVRPYAQTLDLTDEYDYA